MSLIPCDEDCLYQREGYCILDTPTVITNHTGHGCVHYIKGVEIPRPNNAFIQPMPQMPL